MKRFVKKLALAGFWVVLGMASIPSQAMDLDMSDLGGTGGGVSLNEIIREKTMAGFNTLPLPFEAETVFKRVHDSKVNAIYVTVRVGSANNLDTSLPTLSAHPTSEDVLTYIEESYHKKILPPELLDPELTVEDFDYKNLMDLSGKKAGASLISILYSAEDLKKIYAHQRKRVETELKTDKLLRENYLTADISIYQEFSVTLGVKRLFQGADKLKSKSPKKTIKSEFKDIHKLFSIAIDTYPVKDNVVIFPENTNMNTESLVTSSESVEAFQESIVTLSECAQEFPKNPEDFYKMVAEWIDATFSEKSENVKLIIGEKSPNNYG